MTEEKLYADYLQIVRSFRKYLEKRQGIPEREDREGNSLEKKNPKRLLEALYRSMRNCRKCPLFKKRTHLVFGEGNPEAKLMLIGEAPGKNEDLKGKPFVGAAGSVLTEALQRFNIPVSQIYIANVLKCRPPGNRDPSPEEIETCFPYLKRQIEIINPRLICTLGKFAAQVLLNTKQGITSLRGRRQYYKKITLIPIFHPAACIYKPNWKKLFLKDMEMVKKILESDF